MYLSEICEVTRFIQNVEALKSQPYDGTNSDHQKLLEKVSGESFVVDADENCSARNRITEFCAGINDLRPLFLVQLWNLATDSRSSRDWGVMGFQGKDPATDFRGAGVLGLHQLVYIAETRTPVVRQHLVEPEKVSARYVFPFLP